MPDNLLQIQFNEDTLRQFSQAALNFFTTLATALIVFLILVILARLARTSLRKIITRTSKNVTAATLVGNISYIFLIAIAIIAVFSISTGLGVGGFFTALGFLGAGIGFSMQDIFKNFFCGIYLLIEKPFHIGDVIRVKDIEGEVETIEYRVTILKTDNEIRLLVPNSIIFTEIVTHRTLGNNILNVFQIAFPEDFGLTATTTKINEVIEKFEETKVARKPAPQVYLENTSEGKVTVRLEVWTSKDEYFATKSELANALRKALPEVSLTVL